MKFSKTSILLLLFIGFSPKMFANDFYWAHIRIKNVPIENKQYFLGGKLPLTVIDTLAKRYKNTPNAFLFFNRGSNLLAFQPCGFDLLEVNGNQLTQKYKLYNRGYTCGSWPLVRDSAIYLLGSEGIWNSTSDLIRFDELRAKQKSLTGDAVAYISASSPPLVKVVLILFNAKLRRSF